MPKQLVFWALRDRPFTNGSSAASQPNGLAKLNGLPESRARYCAPTSSIYERRAQFVRRPPRQALISSCAV
jgi:hypothetical protein